MRLGGAAEATFDKEVRESLPKEVTLDLSEILMKRVSRCEKPEKNVAGRGDSKCKGPVVPPVLGT